MTRVLVWKELREQGTILAALIALGCAVLIAGSVLLDPSEAGRATELRSLASAGRLALLMLTLTAGVVVGGALFAGEREAGTAVYLEQLPASRWAIWWRKVAIGVVLVAVATAILLAVSVTVGVLSLTAPGGFLAWVMLIGTVALAAYGWGVFGSVLARTSLTACGLGLALGTSLGCVVYVALALGFRLARDQYGLRTYRGGDQNAWVLAFQVAGYVMIVVPMPIAAWLYTAPDRARKLAELQVRVPDVAGSLRSGWGVVGGLRWGASIRRLVWLSIRQLRGTALGLLGASLVLGVALVPQESIPFVVWPVLTLLAGVLVGVVGVADEQTSLAFRFWGERRMPVGRLWLAKVAAGLALVLMVLIALLMPSLIALLLREGSRGPFFASLFRTGLFAEPGFPVFGYLLMWPVYGFVCGHLSALLFRKTVVAGAVAIMTGGVLAVFWLPSFLSGGLHVWQVFVPPLGVLVVARLLSWAWVTDRLGTRPALVRLAAGLVVIFGCVGASLAYRVAEVPLVAEVEDDLQFSRTLPSFDDKQPGRELRRAVAQFSIVDDETRLLMPDSFSASAVDPAKIKKRTEVLAALDLGWPSDKPDHDRWLDSMFASGWDETIATVVDKPAGILEDPNEHNFNSQLRHTIPIRIMMELLLVRALRDQQRGNTVAVPDAVTISLAVIRTARNNTLAWPVGNSFAMERSVYRAIDRWLEQLDRQPALLRAVLAAILDHERRDPYDLHAIQLAHQVVARNLILGPGRSLPKYLDGTRPGVAWRENLLGTSSPAADLETNLITFAWTVPWEQERLRRVIGLGNAPGRWAREGNPLEGAPAWLHLEPPDARSFQGLEVNRRLLLTVRAATVLKLAVRLHHAETGQLPAKLTDLVPKYLPSVPTDPYDGKPFRYRISAGESIELEPDPTDTPATVKYPPGTVPPLENRPFLAFAGLVGSVVCWPLDPRWHDFDFSGPAPPPGEDTTVPLLAAFGGGPGAPAPGGPGDDVTLAMSGPEPRINVSAGQGILWSIGPDRYDNGGVYGLSIRNMSGQRQGDLIFVIPLPETNR